MKTNNPSAGRLEELFRRAGAERPDPDLPPGWKRRLMAEIHDEAGRLGRNGFPEAGREAFVGLLFRFAGAGGLAAAAMLLGALVYGRGLEEQVYQLARQHMELTQFLSALI